MVDFECHCFLSTFSTPFFAFISQIIANFAHVLLISLLNNMWHHQFGIKKFSDLPIMEDTKIVVVSAVKDKMNLFCTLERELRFPSHFDYNWDSLLECMIDESISYNNITIYNDDLSKLSEEDYNRYIEVLLKAYYSWFFLPWRSPVLGIRRNFRVYFSLRNRERIRNAFLNNFGCIQPDSSKNRLLGVDLHSFTKENSKIMIRDQFGIKDFEDLQIREDTKIVKISGLRDKMELFSVLGKELNFPDGFGHNWDALWECLDDYLDIREKYVILYHDDISMLSEEEFCIYVGLLIDTFFSWNYHPIIDSPAKVLCAFFSPRNREQVGNVLFNYFCI